MAIFYFSPATNKAIGGIKVIYKHVELLNAHNMEAYVLHTTPDFKCDWFSHQAPVATIQSDVPLKERPHIFWESVIQLPNGDSRPISTDDIVVIPEDLGPAFAFFGPGIRKVIFNQNAYKTFDWYGTDMTDLTGRYDTDDILGAMVVSDDNKAYLNYAFPSVPVHRVKVSIDYTIFSYSDQKKPQLAYMPRKNPIHAKHVLNLLKFRQNITDLSVVAIENKTEPEVAQILKDSLIFLQFGFPEGCNLPGMESLSCGCLLVGYTGTGPKEYWRPEFAHPFEVWDVVKIAQCVESLWTQWQRDPAPLQTKMKAGSDHIQQTYSAEEEVRSLLNAWDAFLSAPDG